MQQLKFQEFLRARIVEVSSHSNRTKISTEGKCLAEGQSHEHNKDRGIKSNKIQEWPGGRNFPVMWGSVSAVSRELSYLTLLLVKDE